MSFNIIRDSDIVGIGYVSASINDHYIMPNSVLNLVFGQAGRSIDIAAEILGDIESFGFMADPAGAVTNLCSFFGNTDPLCSGNCEIESYPDAIPSSLCSGINLLNNLTGDMEFSSTNYWYKEGFGIIAEEVRSITEEISAINQKEIDTIESGIPKPNTFGLYDPIAGFGQKEQIDNKVPQNLVGILPFVNVVGFGSSGYDRSTSPSGIYFNTYTNGRLNGTPTAYADGSGIWPYTIHQRLAKLNEAENYLKDLLISKLVVNNNKSLFFEGGATKHFVVPNGVGVDYIDFKLWGAGGGGGGGLCIYRNNPWMEYGGYMCSSGNSGSPGSYIKVRITGVKAGDIFTIITGFNGVHGNGITNDWYQNFPSYLYAPGGCDGGRSIIRFSRGSTYYGDIIVAPGGHGGPGGGGRVCPGGGTQLSDASSPAPLPGYILAQGPGLPITMQLIESANAQGKGNNGWFFKDATDYTLTMWQTARNLDTLFPGGISTSVKEGHGRSGKGGDAISVPNSGGTHAGHHGSDGDYGRVEININGYSGGKDTSWVTWQKSW